MSKHQKHKKLTIAPPTSLKPRIDRAVNEGRFQQALELSKQLYKYEPTPDHLALLKCVYLGRGKDLRDRGANQDAATLFEAALRIDPTNPVWIEQLAVELAHSGAVQPALALTATLPASAQATKIQALAVDAALQKQAAGKSLLPPALHADFAAILLAFQQVERGADEAARATLEAIGLRSPFLDWKLLLRGLQAYYQNDDARALENWQRLAPERVPARLAAPFRCQIDPTYRATQPPPTQTALQQQFDKLQGSLLLQQLRTLRAALVDPEHLAAAFRQAEALVPTLKQEAPQLLPRLANCFYWAILDSGPDDIPRYRRVFGSPATDPNFNRLQALANEKYGQFDAAHKAWQAYEKDVAGRPELWPDGQAQRVRALLWMHMGQNAAKIPTAKQLHKLPPPLRPFADELKALNPPAPACFERSLQLDAEQLETHDALFRYFLNDDQPAKAAKAAQHLLERFPDHVPTLAAYGQLCTMQKDYAQGLSLLQRALQANPLDRKLRSGVAQAHLFMARAAAENGQIEEARPEYQAALELQDREDAASILCRWAAAEFKAGDAARAEELLLQASARGTPLVIAHCLLTEIGRLKLPRSLKTRFDKEFNQRLAETPTANDVVPLVNYCASLAVGDITYLGAKTHQNKILKYVDKAALVPFTARQLEDLCCALKTLGANKRLEKFAQRGQREFPNDPVFPYLEAIVYCDEGLYSRRSWKARELLGRAERLLDALPREERRDDLRAEIQKQLTLLKASNPFSFFDDMLGPFGGFEDDFDDDDDDDF